MMKQRPDKHKYGQRKSIMLLTDSLQRLTDGKETEFSDITDNYVIRIK